MPLNPSNPNPNPNSMHSHPQQYKEQQALSVEKVSHGAGGAVIVKSVNGSVHGGAAGNERNEKGPSSTIGEKVTKKKSTSNANAGAGAGVAGAGAGAGKSKLISSSSTSKLAHSFPKNKFGTVAGVIVAGTNIVPSTTANSTIAGPHMKKDNVQNMKGSAVAAGSGARAAKAIPK